jgi:hypothetical protein
MIVFIIFTGCSRNTLEFENIASHKDIVEESEYGKIKMEFSKLDGEDIRSFNTKQGKTYKFGYKYLITEGAIVLQFRDSKDNIITEIILSEDDYKDAKKETEKDDGGQVKIHEFGSNIKVKSSDQKIKIAIIGKEASGKIKITW